MSGPPGAVTRRSAGLWTDCFGRLSLVLATIALAGALWIPAASAAPGTGAASWTSAWKSAPLLQESPPIENRIRVIVRDLLREIRRSVKLSSYFVTSSPSWWLRRAKRAIWPLAFALTALFLDAALLAEWKTDGLRVLVNYVPMMLFVYGRLFVASGTSVVVRLGVVGAFAYGIWRDDFIRDGRWSSIGIGRVDDLGLMFAAVRAFVSSCPEQLVEMYANQAIAIRNRLARVRTPTA